MIGELSLYKNQSTERGDHEAISLFIVDECIQVTYEITNGYLMQHPTKGECYLYIVLV